MSGRKALFLDVDMTLLDSRSQLPEKNKKAVVKALEAGHVVCINTGRPVAGALHIADMFEYDGEGLYLIGFNGAVVYDCYRKKVVASEACDLASVKKVMSIAKQEGIHVQTYDDKTIFVYQPEDSEIRDYTSKIPVPFREIKDLSELDHRELRKVVLIDLENTKTLTDFRKAHYEEIGDQLVPVLSSPKLLEYIKVGVSKGSGIRLICELLDIDIKDTISAGDEENDLAMIKAAGIGCAVKNAVPSVKAVADYICKKTNDECAVAEIIEKFMEISVDD